jgi:hypothetical protein
VNSLRSLFIASTLALALSANTARAADESPFKFEFHGFVVGSLYYQDQVFANAQGQGLLLAAPSNANKAPSTTPTVPNATKSGSLLGGDIRESRFAFSLTGPKEAFLGGTPRAYFEFDLFGLNGAGAYATEQNIPRIRAAIAEVKWGATTFQAGQQNQLVVVQTPATVAHVPNPVTYGAGTIGWRTPGLRILHAIPMDGFKLELGAEVVANNYNNGVQAVNGAQNTPASVSFGNASGLPMIQARAKLDGKAGDIGWSAYLVGVYDSVKLEGFGGAATPPTINGAVKKSIDSYAVQAGGKVNFAPVYVAANGYYGKGTGNMLGAIVQFGDIKNWGAWAQVGVDATKELSIHAIFGTDRPEAKDVRAWAGTRLENTVYGGMIRYMEGGYALGVEGYQFDTKYSTGATTSVNNKGLQIIGSAGYFF